MFLKNVSLAGGVQNVHENFKANLDMISNQTKVHSVGTFLFGNVYFSISHTFLKFFKTLKPLDLHQQWFVVMSPSRAGSSHSSS